MAGDFPYPYTSLYPSPYPIEKVGDFPYPYTYPINAGFLVKTGTDSGNTHMTSLLAIYPWIIAQFDTSIYIISILLVTFLYVIHHINLFPPTNWNLATNIYSNKKKK